MTDVLKTIKNLMKESVKPEDVVALGKAATDNENLKDLQDRLEEILKSSGHGTTLRKVVVIGFGRLIAYYEDDEEARRAEEWTSKEFRNTKLRTTFKSLSVGRSKAGVIFDFTRM